MLRAPGGLLPGQPGGIAAVDPRVDRVDGEGDVESRRPKQVGVRRVSVRAGDDEVAAQLGPASKRSPAACSMNTRSTVSPTGRTRTPGTVALSAVSAATAAADRSAVTTTTGRCMVAVSRTVYATSPRSRASVTVPRVARRVSTAENEVTWTASTGPRRASRPGKRRPIRRWGPVSP
jgi:hypothetical protein